MEKTLIVANWKENLIVPQAKKWLEEFSIFNFHRSEGSPLADFSNDSEVIICPSFVLIPVIRSHLSHHTPHLSIGAQDVSKFEEGQYTGEVSAKMLKDLVKYVIVGHSERRKYFNETDEDVNLKVQHCLKHNLTPIICVSKMEQVSMCQCVNVSKAIFAYEPLFAVGTGKTDTPEKANDFAQKVKSEVGQNAQVLYGGSVTAENVKSFVSQKDLSGVLVGEASLDAEEFAKLCHEIR